MLGTFYLIKWAYFYNKTMLMTLKVCTEISGIGVQATKFVFSTPAMSMLDSVKILCQILGHLEVDKKKILLSRIAESMEVTHVREKRSSIDSFVRALSIMFSHNQVTRFSVTQYFHYH